MLILLIFWLSVGGLVVLCCALVAGLVKCPVGALSRSCWELLFELSWGFCWGALLEALLAPLLAALVAALMGALFPTDYLREN